MRTGKLEDTDASIRCKAILFDMDGTLVDSTQSVEAIWRSWAARHGIDAQRILAFSHGRRTIDTLAEVAPYLDIQAEAERLEVQEIHWESGVKEVAGARALIAQLPAQRWSVVTSASRPLAKARLRMAELPVPAALVCAEDVQRGKPDPEGYLAGASLLGVDPADCLVLEDTPAGIEAGRKAGAQVIGLTTTFSCGDLPGVLCMADYRSLTVVLDGDIINLHV